MRRPVFVHSLPLCLPFGFPLCLKKCQCYSSRYRSWRGNRVRDGCKDRRGKSEKRVIESSRMGASPLSIQTEPRQLKGPWIQTNASAMQNLSSGTVSEPWLQVACVCTCTHTQFHGELCSAIPERICCFSYTHQDLCHMLGRKGKNKTILNYFGYLLGDRSVSSKLLSMHQRSS